MAHQHPKPFAHPRGYRVQRLTGAQVKIFKNGYEVITEWSGWNRFQQGLGPHIQDTDWGKALSPEQREFIISGMTPDEWEALMGDDE